MKLIGRRLRPLSSEWVRTHAEMFATLEENIGMLPAIKSFTREEHESRRFQRSNVKLLRIAKRQLLIESLLTPSVNLLAGLGLLLLLYLSTLQLRAGVLQASDIVSILLYGMLLTRPMSGLAGVYGSVQTARGAAARLIEVFSVRAEPDDAGAPALAPVSGHRASRMCTSPTRDDRRSSRASTWRFRRGRPSPSPGRTVRARAPSSTC